MATANNDLLVDKVFDYTVTKGFLTISDLLKKPSPLAKKLSTKEAARVWIKDHLSTDERFGVQEDHAGKIVSVTVVSHVHICPHYVESGKCPFKGSCKSWHVCKDYIEGNCEKKCRHGKSHDFHDKENGGKTQQLGFGKLGNHTVRSKVAFNLPQLCSAYMKSSCGDTNCFRLHLCAGFVKKTCFNTCGCNHSHNLRSGHNKSVLKEYGFNSWEKHILCNVLLPKKVMAPNNAENSIKKTAKENISKLQNNTGGKYVDLSATSKLNGLSAVKPVFKCPAESQPKEPEVYQSTSCLCSNFNITPSQVEHEDTLSSEDNESVDVETGAGNKPKIQNVKTSRQSVGNVNRSSKEQSLFPPSQGLPSPPAKTSILNDPEAISFRSLSNMPLPPGFTDGTSVQQRDGSIPSQIQEIVSCKGGGADPQDDHKRPGNRAGDCTGFTPDLNQAKCAPLVHQRCAEDIIEDADIIMSTNSAAAADGEGSGRESVTGLNEKKKRNRRRAQKGKAKTEKRQERKADEETELQNRVAKVGLPNCNIPQKPGPSQKLPSEQQLSPPDPRHSQKASEEFGAVSQSNTAEKNTFSRNPAKQVTETQTESTMSSMTVSFASPSVETVSNGTEVPEGRKRPPAQKTTVRSTNRKASTSSSCSAKVEPVEISEKQVFECICKEYGCLVKFSDISGRADLFPNGKADAEAWFRKDARKNSFIITEGENKEILEITAFSSKLRLCSNGSSCCKDECSYFHVCRDFIAGCCTSDATAHEHEFRNYKDKQLISSFKIFNSFTEEQLGFIFRASTPHVCLDYNAGKCQNGQKCDKIHICKDFVRNLCRVRACSLSHDDAYETSHTKALAAKFQMPILTLKRLIVVPQPSQGQLADPGHEPKDYAGHICPDFILEQCKNGAHCAKHHCSLPYQWQYRNQMFDQQWQNFPGDDNGDLERLFCDPVKDSSVQIRLRTPFHEEGSQLTYVDFEEMKISATTLGAFGLSYAADADRTYSVELRRLSTESCGAIAGNPVATTWTWYWKDSNDAWITCGSGSENERAAAQRGIETAFLSNDWCCYYSSHQEPYKLYFRRKPMYQRNKRLNTKTLIRRRPKLQLKDEIHQLKSNQQQKSLKQPRTDNKSTLPPHWSPMPPCKDFTRVRLSPDSEEFKMVEKRFRGTMPEDETTLVQIERVQNPFMLEKFNRKKENMNAKSKGSSLEKILFHGTKADTIETICKQNFDWRRCRANGTMYGQGSSFALHAYYSDRYSRQADHNCSHFMFLANVLVGSYMKGDSSMRLPPPKNPSDSASDLFDSCVDDEDNPEIFVVFEIDQCYPSYVIEYVDIFRDHGVALSRRGYPGVSSSGTSPSCYVTKPAAGTVASPPSYARCQRYRSPVSYGRKHALAPQAVSSFPDPSAGLYARSPAGTSSVSSSHATVNMEQSARSRISSPPMYDTFAGFHFDDVSSSKEEASCIVS